MIYLLTRITYTATVQRDYLWAVTLSTVARLVRARRRLASPGASIQPAGREALVVTVAACILIGWGSRRGRIRIFRLSHSRGDPPAAPDVPMSTAFSPASA